MRNQVQLCTYVDRLGGGGLRELGGLLRGPLAGLFGGVHLLPFFVPIDGADAGFDPIDHTRVDPRLGGWEDVRLLAGDFEVMADVIVNHVSSRSPQYLDFSARGRESGFAGLFLTLDAVFPAGATERDLLAIHRPRPGLPFKVETLQTGERRILWTTFTPEQIDIDVHHPQGRAYLDTVLGTLAAGGVRLVRLDAAGYAVKKAGGTCFMMPETFAFVEELTRRARQLGLGVLVEVHSHFRRQIEVAALVDRVYDFALPPLILHACQFRTARYLAEWIRMRPTNAVTVLDTHDGIGIVDVGPDPSDPGRSPGLVPDADLDAVVEGIHERSRGQSRLATGSAASNLDLYQVNCTFYDALGRDDAAYMLARAIQFFLPGVPQVYYVGLLAGENDMDLLARTGVGRDINRRYFGTDDVAAALEKPVVRGLVRLIRLRNHHPAFAGRFDLEVAGEDRLTMRWSEGSETLALTVDFRDLRHEVAGTGLGQGWRP